MRTHRPATHATPTRLTRMMGSFIIHWILEMLYQMYKETQGLTAELYSKWRDRKLSLSKVAVLPAMSKRHLKHQVYNPEAGDGEALVTHRSDVRYVGRMH